MENGITKCAKCGITAKENSLLTFYRFPPPSLNGSLIVWAEFCFPNDDWTTDEALERLYNQHNMLCSQHFDDACSSSNAKDRLNKFAIPTQAEDIMAPLGDEHAEEQVGIVLPPKDNVSFASTRPISPAAHHDAEERDRSPLRGRSQSPPAQSHTERTSQRGQADTNNVEEDEDQLAPIDGDDASMTPQAFADLVARLDRIAVAQENMSNSLSALAAAILQLANRLP